MADLSKTLLASTILAHNDFDYDYEGDPETPTIAECACGEKLGEFNRSTLHLDVEFERVIQAHAEHISSVIWKGFQEHVSSREAEVWDEAYSAGRLDGAKTGPYSPTKRPNPYESPNSDGNREHQHP